MHNFEAFFFSTPLEVVAGDSIMCDISKIGTESWKVVGTLQSSGRHTAQKATNKRLKMQPWAYNTLECYGCDGCDTYPQQPITFSNNTLYQYDKQIKLNHSTWETNPKPSKFRNCHERVVLEQNGTVTIAFR